MPTKTDQSTAPVSLRDVLLTTRGIVCSPGGSSTNAEWLLDALEIELAVLGYSVSTRLRRRFATLDEAALTETLRWLGTTLAKHVGGNQKHEPLFRRFPNGIPDDTTALWWSKVLGHYLQGADQPCVFCLQVGTCHVLRPCRHVVCDQCFDGANYSACPICEHHVDRSSPFFKPSDLPPRTATRVAAKPVRFKLLDVGADFTTEARVLFGALTARTQALSPDDRTALESVVREFSAVIASWLPEKIPVRENVAIVIGTLLRGGDHAAVLAAARPHLRTATDVLRTIAALSSADPALQCETIFRSIEVTAPEPRWSGAIAKLLAAVSPRARQVQLPVKVHRFKVAKLSRSLRRALLGLLESFDRDRLAEDMLRHRSYWVWIGEFLHPHEYARRFPNVARAFQIVRKKAPDGTPAPEFVTYYGRLERAIQADDPFQVTAVLRERPGELARRIDYALQIAGKIEPAAQELISAFEELTPSYSTPVLLTLRAFLPTRTERAPTRVFFPKGEVARGVFADDERAPLEPAVVARLVPVIEREILRRFAALPAFGDAIVDRALADIVAPFNERTSSPAAVALPRGSHVAIPDGQTLRLFLHWCQSEDDGGATDLDLSVAFYNRHWAYLGVCSYYQLKLDRTAGHTVAVSAGDLRNAPFPDGSSEFVDLHMDEARKMGVRYAVMVVNAYAGKAFSQLERAFAGVMLRDDTGGQHFDPRAVELRFDLQGEHGTYLPLVCDVETRRLHWLDVHARGEFVMNNVATSSKAITTICPRLIDYYASGIRTSMFDLALLHAAARTRRVLLRGTKRAAAFERAEGETPVAFLARIRTGAADVDDAALPTADSPPVLAALHRGDLALPDGSLAYALFREQTRVTASASDFIR